MRGARLWIPALLSAALVCAGPAGAADLKGKWYFGGSLSFLSTTDDIRSNAAIILGDFGDDGVPDTGDANEGGTCGVVDPGGPLGDGLFCDPRPDELLAKETAIEETFMLDLTAGFGLSSWLSLQLDAGYFRGDIGPVDAFLRDHFPVAGNPLNPTILTRFRDREELIPVQAGEVTEIPIQISGIVRFRKDSPLNPYVGVGAGRIFADVETGDDVHALNGRIESMRLRYAVNEFGERVRLDPFDQNAGQDGRLPFRWPLVLEVEDAYEWHLMGGAEYSLNDRVSLVFDVRYMFADQGLRLDLAGQDQINIVTFSEKLFRPDGSLHIYNDTPGPPNTLCIDTGFRGIGCDPNQIHIRYVNPEGVDLTLNPPRIRFVCPTIGDFDKDGVLDLCYDANNIGPSAMGVTEPRGDVIIQGGEIDLTGFTVAIGMRYRF